MKILLDPGHGGWDRGAARAGFAEKEIVLRMGLRLRDILRSGGYAVDMTRKGDVYRGLRRRAKMANAGDYDLVVCLHNNASVLREPYGDQVYVYHEYNLWMAEIVLGRLQEARRHGAPRGGRWTRPEARQDLYMLRKTLPVTLFVEAGFLSNNDDRLWLLEQGGEEIPMALFRGIVGVELELERRQGELKKPSRSEDLEGYGGALC